MKESKGNGFFCGNARFRNIKQVGVRAMDQGQFEQRLTGVLLRLPIPVQIERRQPKLGRG